MARSRGAAPGAHDVLIKVAAAGLNRGDILQRQGKYPPPSDAPSGILGMEASGEVVDIGKNVRHWKKGDKVCALLGRRLRGRCSSPRNAMPAGATRPFDGGSSGAARSGDDRVGQCVRNRRAQDRRDHSCAWRRRRHRHHGDPDDQALRRQGLFTAGTEEKCAVCRRLGADLAINYRTKDFVLMVERTTSGRGVDVVLDCIGGDYVPRNLAALAPLGAMSASRCRKGARPPSISSPSCRSGWSSRARLCAPVRPRKRRGWFAKWRQKSGPGRLLVILSH